MQEYTGQVCGWPAKSSTICVKCVFNVRDYTYNEFWCKRSQAGQQPGVGFLCFFFVLFCLSDSIFKFFLTIYRPYTQEPKREPPGAVWGFSILLKYTSVCRPALPPTSTCKPMVETRFFLPELPHIQLALIFCGLCEN